VALILFVIYRRDNSLDGGWRQTGRTLSAGAAAGGVNALVNQGLNRLLGNSDGFNNSGKSNSGKSDSDGKGSSGNTNNTGGGGNTGDTGNTGKTGSGK
jgi:hypothetical protein